MEIVTAPRLQRPSAGARLLVVLAVVAPVIVLALLPAGLGLERYVADSDAMEPAIPYGSVMLEREVPVSSLRVGDVVSFRPPAGGGADGLVTQRVVSVMGREVRTRGDASPAAEPQLLPGDAPTQSRVVTTVPHLGHVYLFLGQRSVFGTLLGAALAALVALGVGAGVRLRHGGRGQARRATGRP